MLVSEFQWTTDPSLSSLLSLTVVSIFCSTSPEFVEPRDRFTLAKEASLAPLSNSSSTLIEFYRPWILFIQVDKEEGIVSLTVLIR